jgi:hypothetical protein
MTKEPRQSSEKLRGIANITNALVVQMAELLKLREAVQKAEEASARKTAAMQRQHGISSTAYRAQADALEMEAQARHRLATRRDNDAFSRSVGATDVTLPAQLHEARIRNGTRKTKALPGKLFMQSQWR